MKLTEPMNDLEFQAKVLNGVESAEKKTAEQGSKIETLLANYGQLGTDTKKAMEELTLVKNACNSQAEFGEKLHKLILQMRQESRQAFGSPIEKLLGSTERRLAINHMFRSLAQRTAPDIKILEDGGFVTKAGTIASGSTPGSTMIIGQLANEIYDTLASYGIWSSFQVVNVGTKTTTFPVATARPLANWITTEGAQSSDDSTMDGTSVDLTPLYMTVLMYATLQMLDDSEFDVSSMLMENFAQACAYRLDWSCLAADGTNDVTDGGFTGIFSGGTAADAAAGNTTTETLDLEDFMRCATTVAAGLLSRPMRWWMNPQILVRILAVKDGNGRPIFQTALEAPAAGGIGSILGYPITLSNAAPSTNSASQVIAVLGDPRGQVVAMRRGFEFAYSDEFKFDYLRRYFRGTMRAGNKIRAATSFAKLTLAAA